MALDRQSIERRDFPIGRLGYELEAVDAHLAQIAGEIEALDLTAGGENETLAASAGDQVRAIIDAAHASAAQIRSAAEDDARELRAEAAADADAARNEALAQARSYVSRVSESAAMMMQRLESMDGELTPLIEALRSGSGRLTDDLRGLDESFDEMGGVVAWGGFDAESEDPDASAEPAEAVELGDGSTEPEDAATEPEDAPMEPEDAATGSEVIEVSAPWAVLADEFHALKGANAKDRQETTDLKDARLVALNMALNGTARDETDRYLAENFELSDRERLLDEVYASVQI